MTGLVAAYGVWGLGVIAFLSCLVLPIPTSAAMVTAGGFVAAGDLSWGAALLAPFAGAVLGDQTGYWLGRRGGPGLLDRLERRPARARTIARAREVLARRGAAGVFLTRWLFAPLGPYVNFACGVAGLRWGRFTGPALAGKALWVAIYTGAGFSVAGNLVAAGRAIGPVLGLLAGAVGLAVVVALWRRPVRLR